MSGKPAILGGFYFCPIMPIPLPILDKNLHFPPVQKATGEGILAIGGDLCVERLQLAYRSGIFPWYSEDDPIIWWSPDPRFVLFPDELKVSESLARIIKSGRFTVTFDRDFRSVIGNCRKARRKGQPGTWITPEMLEAYCALHKAGLAHSVEVWKGDELAGGLYGVVAGKCFCGESMFTKVSNASKVALVRLVERLKRQGFIMIDCQVHTDHLASMGAREIPRQEFIKRLREAVMETVSFS
jgi:leucyl/phenylalanyl-tRNA---protein transferase